MRQSRAFRFGLVEDEWVLRGEIFSWSSYAATEWLSGDCSQCYDVWEFWESSE